jgi:hypothetical protein
MTEDEKKKHVAALMEAIRLRVALSDHAADDAIELVEYLIDPLPSVLAAIVHHDA